MRATLYSGIELLLAWSKVSTKVCGFTFGSISLHLISKRIKEILTQKRQYNAKMRKSQFNDKNGFRKLKKSIYRFQLYAYAYVRTCTLHSQQQKQLIGFRAKLYTCNILLLTKDRRSKLFCLLLKETQIYFNHYIV